MESENKLFWNIINTFALGTILLFIAYLHFLNLGTRFIIPLLFTVFALTLQYFLYNNLRAYGVLCFLWGFIYLFLTGKLFGIVLFLVSLGFFAKRGFFEQYGYAKLSVLFVLLLLNIISLWRLGIMVMLNTLLEFIGLLFFLIVTLILYEDKLHVFYNIRKEYFHSPLTVLTATERQIAELLVQGQKYNQIAVEMSLSESTVKRTCQKMYAKFEVRAKQEFIDKYLESV